MQNLRRRLISNWGNIVGLIFGILSIYFYIATRQTKSIAYTFSNNTKIYDSQTSTAFSVLDNNNQPIENNIYVTEVALWNEGNLSIEPNEARDPIKIVIFPSKSIIDLKIKQTQPDIAKFSLQEIDLKNVKGAFDKYKPLFKTKQGVDIGGFNLLDYTKVIQLSWDHFDPNFGVRIQIIYEGQGTLDEELQTHITGYILGIQQFRNADKLADKLIEYNPIISRIAPILLSLLSGITVMFIMTYDNLARAMAISFSIIIVITIIVVYLNYITLSVQPPI
jgi:hypothetical protein